MRLDKQYKRLMQQQMIPENTTAEFYEKLDSRSAKHRSFRLQIAIAAACLALMIPITALAKANIVSQPKIEIGKMKWLDNEDGFSVTLDNIKNYPQDAFPENIQSISGLKRFWLNSSEDAEKLLDIDLLENTVLEDANTSKGRITDNGNSAPCMVSCRELGGRLYHIGVLTKYYRQGVGFYVDAQITVEHPQLTQEESVILHSITSAPGEGMQINYEEYTTKEGIPVAIVAFGYEEYVDYMALFAVNNISYKLSFYSATPRTAVAAKQMLIEVLEGYVID